jgi:hypothetical protein
VLAIRLLIVRDTIPLIPLYVNSWRDDIPPHKIDYFISCSTRDSPTL